MLLFSKLVLASKIEKENTAALVAMVIVRVFLLFLVGLKIYSLELRKRFFRKIKIQI